MFTPPQGFRHAATLLLTNRARAISAEASSDAVHVALDRLARDLVALAGDTRAPSESTDWLIDEFNRIVDRLPQIFDREGAKAAGGMVLARVALHSAAVESRDLFLIYAPADRLPIAAPLAVELTKRRISVAFADFEVESAAEFSAAVTNGLAHHRGGVILATAAFELARFPPPVPNNRIRVLQPRDLSSAVEHLSQWLTALRVSQL